ncbi:MAG: hypothetical protein AAGI69_01145 [Cyanobacteria bacterium P01_H01_bin.21]
MQNTPRPLIKYESESRACNAPKQTRLYKRLEEALHTGSEVWFRMPGTRLVGIPIYLDSDYVEVVDVDVAEGYEDDELPDDPYQRTVWLIRLAEISAISYATDRWSKDRFERLLDQSDSDSSPRSSS